MTGLCSSMIEMPNSFLLTEFDKSLDASLPCLNVKLGSLKLTSLILISFYNNLLCFKDNIYSSVILGEMSDCDNWD